LVFKKTDSSKDSNSAKDKKTPKKFFEELAEEAGKAAKSDKTSAKNSK